MKKSKTDTLIVLCLILVVLLFIADIALSFPQNTRLGYLNCNTCHYAVTGGGALNPYGRSTASELSTWSTGIEPVETPWIGSGDLRYLNLVRDNEAGVSSQKFIMENSLELGYSGRYLTGVVGVGSYYAQPRDLVASYKHYVQTSLGGFGVRFGKFAPAFGLNIENHKLPGRNSLGFDTRDAGVNTELTYGTKTWNTNLTFLHGMQGPVSNLDFEKDLNTWEGLATQLGVQAHKLVFFSISGAFTENSRGQSRQAYAGGWVVGNKLLYTMGELTYVSTDLDSHSEGWVDLVGSFKGFDVGIIYRKYAAEDAGGVKLRWLPINHLELSTEFLQYENYSEGVGVAHLFF